MKIIQFLFITLIFLLINRNGYSIMLTKKESITIDFPPLKSTQELREIGRKMDIDELQHLKVEIIDVYINENKMIVGKEHSYLLNHALVSLVAGMYENNIDSLKNFIIDVKIDLITLTRKRGLNEGFDREKKGEEREFIKRYKLYRNLLSQTAHYALDTNDLETFWELFKNNYKSSFVGIRKSLIMDLREWIIEKGNDIPTNKVQFVDVLTEMKKFEETQIRTKQDFKDFINSHSYSKSNIQVIDEILNNKEEPSSLKVFSY